jgi:hypothetical protein
MRIPFLQRRKWRCLDESGLAAYVDGSLPVRQREHAETHLANCATCRGQVAMLVRSQREPSTAVPPAWIARARQLGDPLPAQGRASWAWAGAMACLLLFALAINYAYRPAPQPTVAEARPSSPSPAATSAGPALEHDQVRDLAKPATVPVVIAPPDGASVARDLEVRWQPLPSAVTYEVRVLNADGDTLWRTQTSAERLQIPAAVPLQRGRRYFVLISATLPTGKTVHARAVSFNLETERADR